jgi:hypothetical protein
VIVLQEGCLEAGDIWIKTRNRKGKRLEVMMKVLSAVVRRMRRLKKSRI